MRINTPEISWHSKEAIYSVDIQPKQEKQPLRVATAGIDSNVRIWHLKQDCKTGVEFLSNLSRHEKAVNVVRFSTSGKILASGGDDGTIVLWRLSEKTDAPNIFDDDSEIGKNVETWNAFKVLRGHLEDINDLNWSNDENFMISGSIDHTAIMWDVAKGSKLCIMSEAKHYIHGVAWDPLGQYAAVLSCDRSLRIYNIQTKRVVHNVCKMVYPEVEDVSDEMIVDGEDTPSVKAQRMFHDESVVRRRLDFTSDGNLLIVPSGCLTKKQGDQLEQINTAYVFSRSCLSKPAAVLPGFKQPVTVVRCCPVKFQLRENSDGSADSSVELPYRLVFAVASSDSALLYDTQNLEPFAFIGNIHYAAITDIAWSSDGCQLLVSSRDGFCTIVHFEENELGHTYTESEASQGQKNADVLCNGVEIAKQPSDTDKNAVANNKPKPNPTTQSSQNSDSENREKPSPQEINTNENNLPKESNPDQEKEKMDTEVCAEDSNLQSGSVGSSTQSQESRRVQLVPVSPMTKPPRRVALTPVSSPKTDSPGGNVTPETRANNARNHIPPEFATPKTTFKNPLATERKKRRIQLTAVTTVADVEKPLQ